MQDVKLAGGGLPPSAGPTSYLPSRPHSSRLCQILSTWLPDVPIRLQDPRLNCVPGGPPLDTLARPTFNAALGLLQPVEANPNRLVYHGCIQN